MDCLAPLGLALADIQKGPEITNFGSQRTGLNFPQHMPPQTWLGNCCGGRGVPGCTPHGLALGLGLGLGTAHKIWVYSPYCNLLMAFWEFDAPMAAFLKGESVQGGAGTSASQQTERRSVTQGQSSAVHPRPAFPAHSPTHSPATNCTANAGGTPAQPWQGEDPLEDEMHVAGEVPHGRVPGVLVERLQRAAEADQQRRPLREMDLHWGAWQHVACAID